MTADPSYSVDGLLLHSGYVCAWGWFLRDDSAVVSLLGLALAVLVTIAFGARLFPAKRRRFGAWRFHGTARR